MNTNTSKEQIKLVSFVVPVKDEEHTLFDLHAGIVGEMTALGLRYEIIFIDDGSVDASWKVIETLSWEDSQVSGLRFRRNIGKADALTAGFQAARGEVVFTMDADLQDDPKEISRFLQKLDEGYDIVSGWKKTRHDPWHKVMPSRVFNRMISSMIGVELHDHNCGFKCYRSAVVKDVTLYGEMHRMIPSLASIQGYRSAEIPVEHHPRLHGKSKYGVKRFLRGFMDLQTVYFLKNFRERPLHLFGGLAVFSLFSGLVAAVLSSFGLIEARFVTLAAFAIFGALSLGAIGFLAELFTNRHVKRNRDLPVCETTGRGQGASEQPVTVAFEEESAPRVLVVDDDDFIRNLLRFHLERAGFHVTEAGNGRVALEVLDDSFAVVLLDMTMPVMNGLECLREIRRRHADAKVIMVTSVDEVDGVVGAMKLGAFDYLSKPVDSNLLIGTVTRASQIRSINNRHLLAA